MKKSILNLFGINIENLTDNSFTEDNYQVNFHGCFLKNYSKSFQDKIFGIFEFVEIRDFGRNCYNVTFICKNLKKVNFYGLRKLINSLNENYGPDYLKRVRFSLNDVRNIKDKELDFHSIRYWAVNETESEPIDLYFDRNENEITLIIYGVRSIKTNGTLLNMKTK